MKKLKTFENYEKTGNDDNVEALQEPDRDKINEQMKVIILNIIKVKKYFDMLQETTEQVHDLLMNQFPKGHGFIDELLSRDAMLAELVETVYDTVYSSEAVDEIKEIIINLEHIEQYTEDNLDNILNQVNEYEYDEIEFEDDGEFEDDDDDDIPYMKTPKKQIEEDQLKRKQSIPEAENTFKEENRKLAADAAKKKEAKKTI